MSFVPLRLAKSPKKTECFQSAPKSLIYEYVGFARASGTKRQRCRERRRRERRKFGALYASFMQKCLLYHSHLILGGSKPPRDFWIFCGKYIQKLTFKIFSKRSGQTIAAANFTITAQNKGVSGTQNRQFCAFTVPGTTTGSRGAPRNDPKLCHTSFE